MRTPSPAYLATPERAVGSHLRVWVRDSGGEWRDLTIYPGFNAVASAQWQEDVDAPHATASVSLIRETDRLSISPLHETSPVNRGFLSGATFGPLVDVGRELRIEIAVTGQDRAPADEWLIVFHGRIDTIDPSGDLVVVSCRDLGGELASRWIEDARVYAGGDTASVSFRIWQPGTAYVAGERVVPSDAQRNSRYYTSSGGVSGLAEPAWPTPPSPAATTASDGSIIWTAAGVISTAGHPVEQVMQAILNDSPPASGPVTLYVLGPGPGWVILAYIQERQSVMDALRALALQIGWDVRYRWDSASNSFRLTLFEPERAKTNIDFTFGAGDYSELSALSLDIAGVRNVVRLVYSDRSDLDPVGNPKRKTVQVEDATSISRYGRLFMEIAEGYASQIDSAAEAERMVSAALADLRDMRTTQEATLIVGFPWTELGDLYRFSANGIHYTSDLDLAVYSVTHAASAGELATTLVCRGRPAGAYLRWHQALASSRLEQEATPTAVYTSLLATLLTAAPIVGGVRLDVTYAAVDRAATSVEYEWHLSRTSTLFVPSASTLLGTSVARYYEASNLVPGATYHVKVVPRMIVRGELVRGEPSAAVSVVAGRAASGHLEAEVDYARDPLNGGFETQIAPGEPPDHWSTASGSWGVHFSSHVDAADGISGRRYVRFESAPGTSQSLRSARFALVGAFYFGNNRVHLTARYRIRSGSPGQGYYLDVVPITNTGTEFTALGLSLMYDASYVGSWLEASVTIEMQSGWRYGYLQIAKINPAHAIAMDLDDVRVERPQPQERWIAPVLQGTWVDYGAGFAMAGYMIDRQGFVHLRGLVKSGAIGWGTTGLLFNLPAGYRPQAHQAFATLSNDALGRCTVNSTGQVIAEVGSSVWFSLDGIVFRASGL